MNDLTIKCPKCKHVIKLTEELAGPLLESTKNEYEQRIQLEHQKHLDDLSKARVGMEAEAAKKAAAKVQDSLRATSEALEESESRLHDVTKKLGDAQRVQADFMRKQRALDDEKREMEITIERRIAGGVESARVVAKAEAEENNRLRLAEKDHTLEALQKQIEILKQKSEQGSQQVQGEVQEMDIETKLQEKYPHDEIVPVGKGERGGDIVQKVQAPNGTHCGTILWESKRTKTWSDGWLAKLRDDQRAAKADVAILVSDALPKDFDAAATDLIDGVWVVSFKTFLVIAGAIRSQIIEVTSARKAMLGQDTKMGMVYEYLTGPRFKQRVQAIVESFSSMKEDLDKERKAITKQWAKRDEQIDRVMQGTVGMYGDLQGIAGKTLGEVEGLSMKALEA